MVKHLYQRTLKHNGKSVKAWYFWYYDEDGKQVRKSCGQNGKPCLLKREALAYLDSLKDDELITKKSKITLREFCAGMYDADSRYLTKLKNKGVVFTDLTRRQKATYLRYILDRFGDFPAADLDIGIVDDWLLEWNRSNSWRNNMLAVVYAIYKELYAYKIISRMPEIEAYKRVDQRGKGILIPDEIKRLFPADYDAICRIWKVNDFDPDYQNYVFATMIYLILSTGMRNGEARAIKYDQFIKRDALLINAMFDGDGNRVSHLKKGNETNKKWRIAILPEKTINMLETMHSLQIPHSTDYVFEYGGEPYGGEYLNRHFKRVMQHNGIDVQERNITLHSLRYTYNTMMKREISGEDLRLMLGHTSERMTAHYDRSVITDNLPGLLTNKSIIDAIWQ